MLKAQEPNEESKEEPVQLAVMPLSAKRVEAETVSILDELLLEAVSKNKRYEVIGISDIEAMLGMEKLKDVLGCEDVTCAAEIGGSLGIDHLLSGSVSKLGNKVIINLKLINTQIQKVEGRGQAQVEADESLFGDAIRIAVANLFGEELGNDPALNAALRVQAPAPPLSARQKKIRRIVLWSLVGLSATSAGLWGYYKYETNRLRDKTRSMSGNAENAAKIARRGEDAQERSNASSIATGVSAAATLGLWFLWEF